MTTTFEDEMAAGCIETLFDAFGQAATHYTDTGTSTSCTVIFRTFAGAVDDTDRTDVWVQASEVATVSRGHYFVLSGETQRWTAVDVKDRAGAAWRAHCRSLIERT